MSLYPALTSSQQSLLAELLKQRYSGRLPRDDFYVLWSMGGTPTEPTIRINTPVVTDAGQEEFRIVDVLGSTGDLLPLHAAGYLVVTRDTSPGVGGRQQGWFCSLTAAAYDWQRWRRASLLGKGFMLLHPRAEDARRMIWSNTLAGVIGGAAIVVLFKVIEVAVPAGQELIARLVSR